MCMEKMWKEVEDLYGIVSKFFGRVELDVSCGVEVVQTFINFRHGPVDMLKLHGPKAKQLGTAIFNPECKQAGRETDNPQSNLNGEYKFCAIIAMVVLDRKEADMPLIYDFLGGVCG
ncbi:hypothetical protein E2P81_ATG07309 [Venturia nashicola]|nr:hypothetical protein E2P81_ATG07309 [Venturia nashicola]